jgi:hypothetical protein
LKGLLDDDDQTDVPQGLLGPVPRGGKSDDPASNGSPAASPHSFWDWLRRNTPGLLGALPQGGNADGQTSFVGPTMQGNSLGNFPPGAGARYLAQQYRRFGDWPKAVAAYHSGPSQMSKWWAGEGANYNDFTDGYGPLPANAVSRLKSQWSELRNYLPYMFLGKRDRYDSSGGR